MVWGSHLTTTSFSDFISKLECVSPVSECTVRDYLGGLAQLGIASSAREGRCQVQGTSVGAVCFGDPEWTVDVGGIELKWGYVWFCCWG